MGILSKIASAIRNGLRSMKNGVVNFWDFTANSWTNVTNDFFDDFNNVFDWAVNRTTQLASIPRKAIMGDGVSAAPGYAAPEYDASPRLREARSELNNLIDGRKNPKKVIEDFAGTPGEKVWAYMSQSPADRLKASFDGVDPHVWAWVKSLNERQMARLVSAGSDKIDAIINGAEPRSVGVSGIPECECPVFTGFKPIHEYLDLDSIRARIEERNGYAYKPADTV